MRTHSLDKTKRPNYKNVFICELLTAWFF